MNTPQQLAASLQQSDSFQQWKKIHPAGYLSHFFCQLDAQGAPKTSWEIGFFEPSTTKITVFILLENGDAEIKPADDVFQKEKAAIEELRMEKVQVSMEQAAQTWKEQLPTLFPREQLGDGFLILQTLQQHPLWNFTFITKALKFVNMKIDAGSGKIQSHEEISLVQK